MNIKLGQLARHPVQPEFITYPSAGDIERKNQRLAGFSIAPIRPVRLGQQTVCLGNRFALGLPIDPIVNHEVNCLLVNQTGGWRPKISVRVKRKKPFGDVALFQRLRRLSPQRWLNMVEYYPFLAPAYIFQAIQTEKYSAKTPSWALIRNG